MKSSLLAFIGVGALAAAVHYAVAVSVHHWGLSPAYANWVGFFCAFPVSYVGHRGWSFRGTQASHQHAFPKFLAVALFGFFGNQGLLWAGLQFTRLPFWLLLALVMVIVAASTFVLSRWWAFSHA